jgi:hypothetical protein
MNTKLISLVIVILIVVSGVFVFRKGEVKKESVNMDVDSAINTDNSNDPYVQPKSVTESKPFENTNADVKAITPVKDSMPVSNKNEYYIGGIVITSFKPNDLIKLPLNVEGYSTGNGWAANEGEVGNVEVFDANGKSISNVAVLRSITDWMKYPVYFKASVGDREMMSYIKTDTGTVKFSTSEQKNGASLKTVSIPVRFK